MRYIKTYLEKSNNKIIPEGIQLMNYLNYKLGKKNFIKKDNNISLVDNNNEEFVSWHITYNDNFPDDGYFNIDFIKNFINKIIKFKLNIIDVRKLKYILDNFDIDEYKFFIENNDLGLL